MPLHTIDRSRTTTEETIAELVDAIHGGERGPRLAERLAAATAQVLRLNELELQAATDDAPAFRQILTNAWAESRAARVQITDALAPILGQVTLRRLHAEEYVDLRSAA